jgi:hypothetical protein
MTSKSSQKAGRAAGAARQDSRGQAVLRWAADTARNIAISTSSVLRRLDHTELTLLDEQSKQSASAAPGAAGGPGKAGALKSAASAGFDPYNARPMPKATRNAGASATKPRARSTTRARSSWWRRLFRRA